MAELDPKTREHLQGLCRQITVAHDLDPEIQEELYGHMEDRLLAYLSGEEKLSEEDAFVLVREHFGDAAVLKQLLRDAHPIETHVTYARRLLAAFVVFLTVDVVMKFAAVTLGAAAIWYSYGHERDWISFSQLYTQLMFPLDWTAVGVVCLILIRWNRRMNEGASIYLFRAPIAHMVLLIALLLVSLILSPRPMFMQAPTSELAGRYRVLVSFDSSLSIALGFMVWLWWCDRPPRVAKAMLWGISGWCAWMLAQGSAILAATSCFYFVERGAQLAQDVSGALASGHVSGTSWDWYLLLQPTYRQPLNLTAMFHRFQNRVILYMLPCLLYFAVRWTVKWMAGNYRNDRAGYG